MPRIALVQRARAERVHVRGTPVRARATGGAGRKMFAGDATPSRRAAVDLAEHGHGEPSPGGAGRSTRVVHDGGGRGRRGGGVHSEEEEAAEAEAGSSRVMTKRRSWRRAPSRPRVLRGGRGGEGGGAREPRRGGSAATSRAPPREHRSRMTSTRARRRARRSGEHGPQSTSTRRGVIDLINMTPARRVSAGLVVRARAGHTGGGSRLAREFARAFARVGHFARRRRFGRPRSPPRSAPPRPARARGADDITPRAAPTTSASRGSRDAGPDAPRWCASSSTPDVDRFIRTSSRTRSRRDGEEGGSGAQGAFEVTHETAPCSSPRSAGRGAGALEVLEALEAKLSGRRRPSRAPTGGVLRARGEARGEESDGRMCGRAWTDVTARFQASDEAERFDAFRT